MITGRLLHSVSYAGLWGQAALTVDDFVDRPPGSAMTA